MESLFARSTSILSSTNERDDERACQSVEWLMTSVVSQASRRMGIGAIELHRVVDRSHLSKMSAVKTLHTCLMDRLDVRKGSSKNLVILNIGVNIIAVNPMIFARVSREHPYISCQVFRTIDLLRRSIINLSAQILI
jgi:hypothetical protein